MGPSGNMGGGGEVKAPVHAPVEAPPPVTVKEGAGRRPGEGTAATDGADKQGHGTDRTAAHVLWEGRAASGHDSRLEPGGKGGSEWAGTTSGLINLLERAGGLSGRHGEAHPTDGGGSSHLGGEQNSGS